MSLKSLVVRHGIALFVTAFAFGGCATSDDADTPPLASDGNTELGIARFTTRDTAGRTIVLGLAADDTEVGRLELVHGRFALSFFRADYDTDVVDGRKFEIYMNGTRRLAYETAGYDAVYNDALPANERRLSAFIADPHVAAVLDHWDFHWGSASSDGVESAYSASTNTGMVSGTGRYFTPFTTNYVNDQNVTISCGSSDFCKYAAPSGAAGTDTGIVRSRDGSRDGTQSVNDLMAGVCGGDAGSAPEMAIVAQRDRRNGLNLRIGGNPTGAACLAGTSNCSPVPFADGSREWVITQVCHTSLTGGAPTTWIATKTCSLKDNNNANACPLVRGLPATGCTASNVCTGSDGVGHAWTRPAGCDADLSSLTSSWSQASSSCQSGQLIDNVAAATASKTNYALPTQGATVTGSSVASPFTYASLTDGEKAGANWTAGNGGGWRDDTANTFPDWVEIDLGSGRVLNEIDVYTLQNGTCAAGYTCGTNFKCNDPQQTPCTMAAPIDSTPATTWGIQNFTIEYWDVTKSPADWTAVPNGTVSGNTLAWIKRSFSSTPVTTDKIRIDITQAPNTYSRLVEVEAWGPTPITTDDRYSMTYEDTSVLSCWETTTEPPAGALVTLSASVTGLAGDESALSSNIPGFGVQGRSTSYSSSYELPSAGTAAAGWQISQSCASDGSWSVGRYDTSAHPAPDGGSYALRLHTTGFTSGCSNPGVYALSPSIPAAAGETYRLTNWSRNVGNVGTTTLRFYDSAGAEIAASSVSVTWTPDALQYNQDPVLTAVAPTGTATVRYQYALLTANANADLDLLDLSSATVGLACYAAHVKLTATTDDSNSIVWGQDCSSTPLGGSTCSLTMTGYRYGIARFSPPGDCSGSGCL